MSIDLTLSPLLNVRAHYVAALEADDITAYGSPTSTPRTPCVVLAGKGWTIQTTGVVLYRVQVTCLVGVQGAQLDDQAEDLARRAVLAGATGGFLALEVPEPQAYTIGDTAFWGVQFTVTHQVALAEIEA